MKKQRKYALGFVALIIALLICFVIFWQNLPYQIFIAHKIKNLLEAKNIKVSSLNVDKMSCYGAELSNIEIESPVKASIEELNIGYDLMQIISSGFKLTHDAKINSLASDIKLKVFDYETTIASVNLQTKFDESQKKLQGEISIPSIVITGLPTQIEPIEMKITFSADKADVSVLINLHDKNDFTKSDIELSMPSQNLTAGNMLVKYVQIPWGGGVISANKINIPLNLKDPVKAIINLKDVDLSETLGKASEEKIKGTGRLNGNIPITYNPDGSIIIEGGEINSSGIGIISVSPSLLPGDNEQLALARSILENFHYTKLKIMLSSSGDKSELALSLQGKNPDASGDRPINFNINLSGDILPLVQNGIMPFNDIKKLSQKEK